MHNERVSAVRNERALLLGGCPPSPSWSGGIPPSISCRSCGRSVCYCSVGSPSSLVSWMRAGGVRQQIKVYPAVPCLHTGGVSFWVHPPPWWMHALSVRCCSGSSPYYSSIWPHAGGRALPVLIPCARLHSVGVPYPRGILRVIPAPLGPRGGWVT